MAPKYEIAVGLQKGHKTSKIRVAKTKTDKKNKIVPARFKGVSKFSILYIHINFIINAYVNAECNEPYHLA